MTFQSPLETPHAESDFSRPKGPPEPASPAGRSRSRTGHCERAVEARQEAGPEGGTAQERAQHNFDDYRNAFCDNYGEIVVVN